MGPAGLSAIKTGAPQSRLRAVADSTVSLSILADDEFLRLKLEDPATRVLGSKTN